MTTSTPFSSSILTFPNPNISNPDLGPSKIGFLSRKKQSFASPISVSGNSAVITSSLTLDHDSINDEEVKRADSKIGSQVRVKGPLKVYHVPKVPEFDLDGKVGVLKQYVGIHKGKRISANFPYKVEFALEDVPGRDGKPVKFAAHLREDEFEFLD